MNILVLNIGSSSVKYKLFDMLNNEVLAMGIVEKIGLKDSFMEHFYDNQEKVVEQSIPNHSQAITLVLNTLQHNDYGIISDTSEIDAVGHRVVHGGEKFAEPILITENVIKQIEEVSSLAPLHNPHNLRGIKACEELILQTPQVAVFDTSFHQTMPEEAYIYALPYEYYKKYGIRRYGFHGTSHKYVAEKAVDLIDKDPDESKIITCHLGNGASVTAVEGLESVDTSMGLTPLEGLVMGTRCGDIDPAIIPFIIEEEDFCVDEVDNILNKDSGLLGISGISGDFRDIQAGMDENNSRAVLAYNIFARRVKKYIGSYITVMNGVDAVVFTAGIGENAVNLRRQILKGLECFGIQVDLEANEVMGKICEISSENSRVKVFVIPTDEELEIALSVKEVVEK